MIAVGAPANLVAQQVLFLKLGNSRQAFTMNIIANCDRWCNPDRFDVVMRSHTDFNMLFILHTIQCY